ncbi:exodeoxyribonuclease 7 large subunit [Thalassobacillus devorans]|uniref:Exodeoxyribonuclease 7 large subunit n=1 Tax=Thalassobacillus devorans TaxID=279813 RepID=A0ABQ1P590_9BACI|nr:exodeoxyribonuclease VII large subunit [Thalassobacillus devorans]NIK29594.1 exodeoxyribonuclease VII large subunit [Thalassobacillus devorans]GGC91298.1 exodeoxyribonuclease 7 large subunit [Thalassobacillus devorans]
MDDRYLTVTALTKYIKRKFSSDPHLKEVWLRGEISNFKHHSRGHMYLSLKDDKARLQAVMFAGNNRFLKFTPENGMNVLVRGEIGVYEPMGQYQLYIHEMEPDGIGALYLAFEQLKEKLEKEGLFEPATKKQLPVYPKHIGIITSPTGAAIRDILTTINRRYPVVKRSVLPVLVQGERAKDSIVKAIEYANRIGAFDVLIVGRGGGSIEDLWSFNEEAVARAIAESHIPVISAVGHETDYTISDFVADIRAATPTGAAELAVPSQVELNQRIMVLNQRLHRALQNEHTAAWKRLDRLKRSYAFKYPAQLTRQKEQQLDRLIDSLNKRMETHQKQKLDTLKHINTRLHQHHPERQVKQTKERIELLSQRLNREIGIQLNEKQKQFNNLLEKMTLLNPLDIMKRGYAIPFNESGNVIRGVESVQPGEAIQLKLQNGSLDCQVWGIEEDEYE